MNNLPKHLAIHQEAIRNATISKIQEAIDGLATEGFVVSKKLLIERTGFSPSLFSKSHVIEVLKQNMVCQFRDRRVVRQNPHKDTLVKRESELLQAYKTITRLEKAIEDKNRYIKNLESERRETADEIQILRGQLFVLLEKAKIHGVVLE